MKSIRSLSLCAVVLALSACAGGGEEAGMTAETIIYTASVTDPTGVTSQGTEVLTIAATTNGGRFSVKWKASAATPNYVAYWYISVDPYFQSDDEQFLGFQCGLPAPYDHCANQKSANWECEYRSDVSIDCGDGYDTSLSSYFSRHNGLPGSYYILLRACDGLFEDCKVQAFPANFY